MKFTEIEDELRKVHRHSSAVDIKNLAGAVNAIQQAIEFLQNVKNEGMIEFWLGQLNMTSSSVRKVAIYKHEVIQPEPKPEPKASNAAYLDDDSGGEPYQHQVM